jgi:SAM-dependent methyltransferase
MDKPYAPACDRNRDPILAVLRERFAGCRRVLEIGSGTGQHAVHFAYAMPHLTWQASDRAENLPGIAAWLDEAALANAPPPIELDVNAAWPAHRYDAVFSANTLHIMSVDEVARLFARLPEIMASGATLVIYGPFSYGGRHTSASNAAFDARLRRENPAQGVRDFAAIDALAAAAGLALIEDRAMPANNRCLVWRRAT